MVDLSGLLIPDALSALSVAGPSVGLKDLDALTRGLLPGSFWVVLASPGAGRTVLACQVAAGAAAAGADTALVLGREPATTAAANMLCARGRVPEHRMRAGGLDSAEADRARRAAEDISGWPLRVLTPADRQWHFSNSVSMPDLEHWLAPGAAPGRRVADVLVLDDLDLLTPRPMGDVLPVLRRWANISGQTTVVTVAEEPFLDEGVVSALVRREADVAVRLVRPDLHDRHTAHAGEATVDVVRHRNGPSSEIAAAFEGHFRRFADLRLTAR